MKLAIIGAAGSIGAPTAYRIAMDNLFEEIKMVDIRRDLLKNHVMDMSQAVIEKSDTKVTFAEYDEIGDCDIFINVAAAPAGNVRSRDEWLPANLATLRDIHKELKKVAHNKLFINATNPSDVCTYFHYKQLGWDRGKIIGFCVNDSIRIKWGLHQIMGLDYRKLDCLCIGEHGVKQVPLWGSVTYDGEPLAVPRETREQVVTAINDWTLEYLGVCESRTTGWLSSLGMLELVRAVVKADPAKPIGVTTFLDGEYGETGVCLGVPAIVGPEGVIKIVEWPLDDEEKRQYGEAAEKVRGLIRDAGI